MSDDPVREWILSEGKATQIKGISPIGGGCINQATRYDTDAGSFFVKTNRYFDYVSPVKTLKRCDRCLLNMVLPKGVDSFLIWYVKNLIRSIGPSMFEGEALGLNAMYETGSIRVPKPYKVSMKFFFSCPKLCRSFPPLPPEKKVCNCILEVIA